MTGPLDGRYRRARTDPLGVLLAGATEVGVRFRWAGADLQLDRLDRLPLGDQILLARHLDAIVERLAEPEDESAPLEQIGIEIIELITDAGRAKEVIRELPPQVGLDIETEVVDKQAPPRPWLAITKRGRLSKVQPTIKDKSGLDPRKARPRLIQIYSARIRTAFLVDLRHVPLEALSGLWTRQLVIHNAGFEVMMLGALGISLPNIIDTQQMAGLLLGCARRSRRLENVAEEILGTTIGKGQQLSDWSAPRLSKAQVQYAAIDAAVALRAGRAMHTMMDEQLRRCFRLQNSVVPVVAKMRLAGVPFDPEVHLETIVRWEHELAEKRAAFVELTGEEPPARHLVGAWIEAHLPPEEIEWMPRTEAGTVSAKAELLKYLAHREEIRPLLRVLWARKRLESFGHTLLGLVDQGTGRIYPDYMACGAKTGRLTSNHPNAQQLPKDARVAIRAPAGRLLVIADLDQIELRVLAELAGEEVMRHVFASGGDLHRRTAASMTGAPEEEIGKADPRRKAAKAINFGIIFAAGPRTLRASAWAKFDIDMSLEEAANARAAVLRTYPAIRPYQERQAQLGQTARVIHSASGRPLRASWERNNELKYTTCSNFPVQSSAADILLRSMVLLDRALVDLEVQLILSVHDELVIETAEDVAEEVKQRMIDAMTTAYVQFFPDAPTTTGLVDASISDAWG